MHSRRISTFAILLTVAVAFMYALDGTAGGSYARLAADAAAMQQQPGQQKKMIDMISDDSYMIDYGDSTIFILVGNFAAHHNGAVILADSAVRYGNQSFECFGNVLINQNTTYIYGDRAEYNRDLNRATVYSDLVKIVDGDATMYTYNCTFDTHEKVGEFFGGCYAVNNDNLLEADHGYYYTDTHELIAVDNVEMRNDRYEMTGDSVIYNVQTDYAQYFDNTHMWNDKGEYMYADAGTYDKQLDLYKVTRNGYILTGEREIWGDSIDYRRTEGHIIARHDIQVDDTLQKVLGFADYGEYWEQPGNAFITRRPSMINYDPQQVDSLFMRADTVWLYTISARPDPAPAADTEDDSGERISDGPLSTALTKLTAAEDDTVSSAQAEEESISFGDMSQAESPAAIAGKAAGSALAGSTDIGRTTGGDSSGVADTESDDGDAGALRHDDYVPEAADSIIVSMADTLASEQPAPLTKEERRRLLKEQAERDKAAAKVRRDSLAKIKLDTIIARRKAKNAERLEKDRQRAEQARIKLEMRRRARIDKAKAKAARKGVEYTGEDYLTDTLPADTLAVDSLLRDVVAPDSLSIDSLSADSLAADSFDRAVADSIPADSVYRMIKAYGNVKMYRTDSQMVCDSLVTLNTDSVIHLYIEPILWNESNQVTSDFMDIYTANQVITRAEFIDRPIMATQIDTVRYNQVKGKKMTAYFDNGKVYRNDVNGNAQTIYYLQEDEQSDEVQGLMYIESADVTFYLDSGKIDKITYRDHPEYIVYPMDKIPETQILKLPDFDWFAARRPTRNEVFDRVIRPSRRADAESRRRPTFPITERIDRYRQSLIDRRRWTDRMDQLTPEIIEWRNSRRR